MNISATNKSVGTLALLKAGSTPKPAAKKPDNDADDAPAAKPIAARPAGAPGQILDRKA